MYITNKCHEIFCLYFTIFTWLPSVFTLTGCFAAIPITFVQQLKNMQAEEGSNVILRCELSKPGIPVAWRKEHELLKNGVKYQIRKRETTLELLIWKPVPEDSGVYSCVCADQMTSATIKITGRIFFLFFLFHQTRLS